ncbi:uncharacterized protein RHOBADRAFT_41391 [Rhodotorula graminis WP1]|uniref:Uncharacterized protein n=1 Tax=Rhodotorula graminis (strain WP1) TaxID=578459 RepID=A0A194S9Y8_RHOGW|nr:uncharacterized protein RHOBADRAFT_41391 [Rhodotorula graminis WP1]KPV77399.1 hypothetical protein RHOBADRAFT_41391 [Rhodotorula graminis WP1]
MSAVVSCVIPTGILARDKFLSPHFTGLHLVLKHLIRTKRRDPNRFVVRDRSALIRWREAVEDHLTSAWVAAPAEHRELFAKAMVWWDRRLQHGDLLIAQMPPTSVLKGWLGGDTRMERYWDEDTKTWRTHLPHDLARASAAAHSLSKAPRAQLGLRAAQIYGLDGQDWEERNAARRF